MEQECCQVEKTPEAHAPGRWTDTWMVPNALGAALWELSVGTEQALAEGP